MANEISEHQPPKLREPNATPFNYQKRVRHLVRSRIKPPSSTIDTQEFSRPPEPDPKIGQLTELFTQGLSCLDSSAPKAEANYAVKEAVKWITNISEKTDTHKDQYIVSLQFLNLSITDVCTLMDVIQKYFEHNHLDYQKQITFPLRTAHNPDPTGIPVTS